MGMIISMRKKGSHYFLTPLPSIPTALIYYRHAVQLVPDIEYRVHSQDTPRHLREGEKYRFSLIDFFEAS